MVVEEKEKKTIINNSPVKVVSAEQKPETPQPKNDEEEFEIIDNSTPESAQQGIQGTAESLTIEAERARALEEQKKTAANIPTYLEEQSPQTTKIEEVKEQAKTEEVQTEVTNPEPEEHKERLGDNKVSSTRNEDRRIYGSEEDSLSDTEAEDEA